MSHVEEGLRNGLLVKYSVTAELTVLSRKFDTSNDNSDKVIIEVLIGNGRSEKAYFICPKEIGHRLRHTELGMGEHSFAIKATPTPEGPAIQLDKVEIFGIDYDLRRYA